MKVEQYLLKENDGIPNNNKYPLLIYRKVFTTGIKESFEKYFYQNNWTGHWINGIYNYHHYHSTSHEALGVIEGSAKLILGGPDGKEVDVKSGDLVILPAGTGHCKLKASDDFKVLGAYPKGQENYDLCTEKDDIEKKKNNINSVPPPDKDPVQNSGGILKSTWK